MPHGPIIRKVRPHNLAHHGKSNRHKPVEKFDKAHVEMPVEKELSLLIIVYMEKLVALRQKIDPLSLETPSQPFTAVETYLDMIGKPGLQPYIHEPVLVIIKIKIQVLTPGPVVLKLGISGLCTVPGTKR